MSIVKLFFVRLPGPCATLDAASNIDVSEQFAAVIGILADDGHAIITSVFFVGIRLINHALRFDQRDIIERLQSQIVECQDRGLLT